MQFANIHEKISRQAEKNANKTAIEYGGSVVTYRELEEYSNRIAKFLYKGYTNKKNVLLLMESNPFLVNSILGVMKSGGVFVPVDPSFPLNRISCMIEEVQAEWVITEEKWLEKIDAIMEKRGRIINALVPGEWGGSYKNIRVYSVLEIEEELKFCYGTEEIKNCYIYFTSGSTGKPKGILGRHRSLSHFIEWESTEFGVTEEFIFSQFTSPSFDPFLRDVFLPLCTGAKLCIPKSKEIILDPRKMKQWIEDRHITLIHMVPSLFKVLMSTVNETDSFKDLRYILLAGEMLRGNDIRKFTELFYGRIKLINLYGPTETTLAKFFYVVKKEDVERTNIPVGKPISFTQPLILDENMKLSQVGNYGEVYIRTPFISSGYFNDASLTKKVFLKNPFNSNPQDILYKTGDMGRLMPDGNLEITGRADHQVKIRGFRIELEEIENRLISHKAIKDAIVVARENEEGDKHLCAYIVDEGNIRESELREFLLKELPEYMIPTFFVRLKKMPLTPNGKIDRKSFPAPEEMQYEDDYIVPSNEIEKDIAGIWEKVLKRRNIGVKDSFFEIGGNSLLLIQMHTLLEEKYPGRVKITDIFNYPTVSKLAEVVSDGKREGINISVAAVSLPETYMNTDDMEYESSVIKFNIPKEVITSVAQAEKVEETDILLGIYLYLLREITGQQDITVQVTAKHENVVVPLYVNFNEINDFITLFEKVKKCRNRVENAYFIEDIKSVRLEKGKCDILPLFCMGELLEYSMNLLEFYEIILKVKIDEEEIRFLCEYEPSRLKGNRVEEFIDNYCNLIHYVYGQYYVS